MNKCVPGRIFRPGNEARDYEASEPRLLAREGVAPQDIHSYHGYDLCSYKASRSHVYFPDCIAKCLEIVTSTDCRYKCFGIDPLRHL